ncbi:MAG TPA: DUF1343 domain-containing protein [Caldilineae bacterium]|nr:DUF1343 domain-containing protein [Caldilineae bacterium]
MSPQVWPGVDVLLKERLDLLRGRRVALLTNPSGVAASLESTLEIFYAHPDINLVALFSPEHGLYGAAADAASIPSGVDPYTGLPVHSLYGETRYPTREMLEDIDCIVVDLQDVGVRFYTYLWTMTYVMEAAAEAGLPVIILDRPNPLGGRRVEGPMLEPGFDSFVGRWPIPLRHGMTLGELARYFNGTRDMGVDLTVVPMRGWRRGLWWHQTGLAWVPPSPGMPSLNAVWAYPGTCFLEGTNLSEGRGTALPFQITGAPWVDGEGGPTAWDLARTLNELGLPGVRFRPTRFTPCAGKWADQPCAGIQVHVLDLDRYKPIQAGLHIIATVRKMYPERFAWRPTSWEGRPPHFDLLAGNAWIREALEAGESVESIASRWGEDVRAFIEARQPFLIYPD